MPRWTRRLALTFDDAGLEREFRVAVAGASRRRHRVVWSGLVAFLLLPTIADLASAGSAANLRVLLAIRVAFTTPLLVAVAAFGWTPAARFARGRDLAVTIGALAVACHSVLHAALMPDPASFRMRDGYISVIVVIFAICALLSVRFIRALGVAVAYAVCMVALIAARFPDPDVLGLAFWVAFATAAGLSGGWQIEHSQRAAFIANRRTEQLLGNVLPAAIAERLKDAPTRIADQFDEVTVLFGDIAGFTPLAAEMAPGDLVALLDEIFSRFDDMAQRHGLEKIKTIGDAYMVVGGVPAARADHAEAVAAMALEMRDALTQREFADGRRLSMRIGIHSGPVVAGVIGKKKLSYDLWGDTVNTASRMESHGAPGRIHVSEACHAALAGRFRTEERGVVEIKGKGPMRTWWLEGRA
jgi:class 3 adenylate cyclase